MRERGLKFVNKKEVNDRVYSRSREGAWIEIVIPIIARSKEKVAPVRERGLKLKESVQRRWKEFVAPVRERGLK